MSQEYLEAFAASRREAQEAFNRGEFKTAFAGLAPDVEWRLLPSLPDTGVLNGRDAVIRYFSGVADVGAWKVEALEFIDAGEGRVLIHQRGTGTGTASGITQSLDFFQIWEVSQDGLVRSVQEYERRADALDAAGLRG